MCIINLGGYFTNWVEAYPMANCFVHHFISRCGVPDSLYMDQGHNL